MTALKIAVSAGLIVIGVVVGRRQHVLDQLRLVPPRAIAEAAAFMLAAWAVNSVRWRLLLRVVGVVEGQAFLAGLYFLGGFFSQLLPTGAGGDAVRMWELYRRGHKPGAVIVATLQERLMGMGVSMGVGCVAAIYYFARLPASVRPLLLCLPLGAVAAMGVCVYPRVPLRMLQWVGHWRGVRRLMAALRPAAELPGPRGGALAAIVAVTLLGDLLSFASWWVLGRAVDATVPFGGYCLVIPMVWIISMAPSLGGAGVREGGFIVLMRWMFGTPKGAALAVAGLFLVIQTVVAGIGGIILVVRVWRGTWKKANAEP
jgi:glycosyltransferase 2 family protein